MICDVGLGSNLGNRLGHLQSAVDGFRAHPRVDVRAVSRVYETDPVGGPPQGAYLNAVVRIETSLTARDLLEVAQRLETAADRVREKRWGARTLDVDLLRCVDSRVDSRVDEPGLTLPHPLMPERAFVLVPLADVDPDVDLARVDTSGVRKTAGELR